MPAWKSKKQVKTALEMARREAVSARDKYGGDSAEYKAAIRKCASIQTVLDKWDALHSRW